MAMVIEVVMEAVEVVEVIQWETRTRAWGDGNSREGHGFPMGKRRKSVNIIIQLSFAIGCCRGDDMFVKFSYSRSRARR